MSEDKQPPSPIQSSPLRRSHTIHVTEVPHRIDPNLTQESLDEINSIFRDSIYAKSGDLSLAELTEEEKKKFWNYLYENAESILSINKPQINFRTMYEEIIKRRTKQTATEEPVAILKEEIPAQTVPDPIIKTPTPTGPIPDIINMKELTAEQIRRIAEERFGGIPITDRASTEPTPTPPPPVAPENKGEEKTRAITKLQKTIATAQRIIEENTKREEAILKRLAEIKRKGQN